MSIQRPPPGGALEARTILAYGLNVRLCAGDPGLLERLIECLPPVWSPVATGRFDHAFVLVRESSAATSPTRAEYLLSEQAGVVARSVELDRVLEAFEHRFKMYIAEMARDRVFVHAGAVGWEDGLIVLPGRSTSGKTSLVAELLRAGASYYSDEYAVLDDDGLVHPYPVPLGVRGPGSLLQTKRQPEAFGASVGSRPLPIRRIVVSRYRPGARWRPRELSAGQAVLELLANTVAARRAPDRILRTLERAVAGAIGLKGDRGEAEAAVRLLLAPGR